MGTSTKIPEGLALWVRNAYFIPRNFVAIWANPDRTRWYQFWIPRYRYSYLKKEVK